MSYGQFIGQLKEALRLIKLSGDVIMVIDKTELLEQVRDLAWIEAKLSDLIKSLQTDYLRQEFGEVPPPHPRKKKGQTVADKQIEEGLEILKRSGIEFEEGSK